MVIVVVLVVAAVAEQASILHHRAKNFTYLYFMFLQLKIEGISGSSFRGDIAIDDISVAYGFCGEYRPLLTSHQVCKDVKL